MEQESHGRTCKCPHHNFIPILIVLFGLAFLLRSLGVMSAYSVSIIWPILVGVGGILKLMEGSCTCCTSVSSRM